jgi:hypothetical protein
VLLDPDVTVRADRVAVAMGTSAELRGATVVADAFLRRFRGVHPALINGALGAVWAPGERPRVAFVFTVAQERITSVELLADPEQLQKLDLESWTRGDVGPRSCSAGRPESWAIA